MENNQRDESRANAERLRKQHDADSGNDGSGEITRTEELIDPGNEHHHPEDLDQSTEDQNAGHSSRYDADSGSDATGTTGSEPGAGENDSPGTRGEAG